MLIPDQAIWAAIAGASGSIVGGLTFAGYWVGRKIQRQDGHEDQLGDIARKIDAAALERDGHKVLLLQALEFGRRNARHIAHLYEVLSVRPPAPSVTDINGEGGPT